MTTTTDLAIKLDDVSVCIGFPCGQTIPAKTARCLAATVRALASRGIAVDTSMIIGSSVVTVARNACANAFLKGNMQRLFWIDSDIEWDVNDFLKMLALSSRHDVICAAYPIKSDAGQLVIRHPDLENFEINPLGLVKINGTGLGFTIVSRAAMEKVAATKQKVWDELHGEEMADIFRLDTRLDPATGRRNVRGEDIAFFADLEELGYDVWLDPTVRLGHIGLKSYSADVVEALGLNHVYRKDATK